MDLNISTSCELRGLPDTLTPYDNLSLESPGEVDDNTLEMHVWLSFMTILIKLL